MVHRSYIPTSSLMRLKNCHGHSHTSSRNRALTPNRGSALVGWWIPGIEMSLKTSTTRIFWVPHTPLFLFSSLTWLLLKNEYESTNILTSCVSLFGYTPWFYIGWLRTAKGQSCKGNHSYVENTLEYSLRLNPSMRGWWSTYRYSER
jgi:hypothetical protein